ncbi:MAG: hypothetical protein QXZ09_00740 [Candidatus Methanomethylicaceae archaeon]
MRRLRLIRTEGVPDEVFDFARALYEKRFSGLLEVEVPGREVTLEGKRHRLGIRGMQYLADDILRDGGSEGGGAAIVITSADIYTYGTNYIFGLATIGAGLVSTARIDPNFWDFLPEIYRYSEKGKGFFLRQLGKVLLHELGHALSLGHCHEPGCVMRYSNSPIELYSKGEDYCAGCWKKLVSFLRRDCDVKVS